MAAVLPTVRIGRRGRRTVVTLDGGVPEEDVVVKQDVKVCNRDKGVPEKDVFVNHDGASCNRA